MKVDWIGYYITLLTLARDMARLTCFCVGFPQLDNYYLNFSFSGQGMGGIAAFPNVVVGARTVADGL